MRTAYPRHLKTFSYVGPNRYFLTFCTHQRARTFTAAEAIALVLSQFLRTLREESFALIAYCFMPDHVHLLVEGMADMSDCLRFIRKAKQYSGYYYSRETGQRLWQRYGYERVLRNEESTRDVARYILENPIRAGLVEKAEDYPFMGSEVYAVDELLSSMT